MAQQATGSGRRRAGEERPSVGPVPDDPDGSRTDPICTVAFCPICFAVTSAQPIAPDVIGHLLSAGREFMLAMGALLSTRADPGDKERVTRFEKIDIG